MGAFTLGEDSRAEPEGFEAGQQQTSDTGVTQRSGAKVSDSPVDEFQAADAPKTDETTTRDVAATTVAGPVPVTQAQANQLLWLGRYTERVFTTLVRFSETYDANVGLGTKDFSALCNGLGAPFDAQVPAEELVSKILYDEDSPFSVCSSMRCAFGNAIMLRPELGTDTTSHIELALLSLRRSKDPEKRLSGHRAVRDSLLAFWGAVEDGACPDETRALLFLGKYLERVELWSRFGVCESRLDRPVRKLVFFLGYVRHPECLPIDTSLAALEVAVRERGYGESVTDRLQDAREMLGGLGGTDA